MAAEVKLPMVGGVSKKALAIGGVAAVGVLGFIFLRKRNSSSSSSTTPTTDTSGTPQVVGYDANGNPIYSDGTSGAYVDPGLQDSSFGPTYGQTGYYDPNTGQWVYGNSGTGQALATTNAQWAQNAISYLAGSGVDTGALSSALGAYLAGQALTSDQVSLVDQAIAVEGYPPTAGAGGNPPGIREAGTASQGGTGGSGGGVTGNPGGPPTGVTPPPTAGGTSAFPAPSGVRVTNKTAHEFSLAWNRITGASAYRVQVKQLNGVVIADFHVPGPGATVSAGTHPGYSYNVGIQALPGGKGTNISVTLPRK